LIPRFLDDLIHRRRAAENFSRCPHGDEGFVERRGIDETREMKIEPLAFSHFLSTFRATSPVPTIRIFS